MLRDRRYAAGVGYLMGIAYAATLGAMGYILMGAFFGFDSLGAWMWGMTSLVVSFLLCASMLFQVLAFDETPDFKKSRKLTFNPNLRGSDVAKIIASVAAGGIWFALFSTVDGELGDVVSVLIVPVTIGLALVISLSVFRIDAAEVDNARVDTTSQMIPTLSVLLPAILVGALIAIVARFAVYPLFLNMETSRSQILRDFATQLLTPLREAIFFPLMMANPLVWPLVLGLAVALAVVVGFSGLIGAYLVSSKIVERRLVSDGSIDQSVVDDLNTVVLSLVHHSLMARVGTHYQFSHRTIQEYLVQ